MALNDCNINRYLSFFCDTAPQEAPKNVEGLPFNSTAVEVRWDPLPASLDVLRGRLLGHRV